MPIRRDRYEKMIEERVAAELASQKEERRYWIITLLVCMLWCALGAVVTGAGFAMHLTPEDADVLIDAGQGIAAAGVLATVTYAGYHRRKRGLE
jgi:high-affinity K+ transport system ATPase subunit B